MTICIAAIYTHIYGDKDFGPGIITTSDRMLTNEALAIQYEPDTGKWAWVDKRVIILVADNISIHSELLIRLRKEIDEKKRAEARETLSVSEITKMYGDLLRSERSERASHHALSLYNLTSDTFIARQQEMSTSFIEALANNMEDYANRKFGVQTLVAGCDDDKSAHIYYLDSQGISHCFDDAGYASIGIGHAHVNSQFMTHRYTRTTWGYYPALLLSYAAKKTAEAAPGVGSYTDMIQITRDGIWQITEKTKESLDKTYETLKKKMAKLQNSSVAELMKLDAKNIKEAQKEAAANSKEQKGQNEPKGSDQKKQTGGVYKRTSEPKG